MKILCKIGVYFFPVLGISSLIMLGISIYKGAYMHGGIFLVGVPLSIFLTKQSMKYST